MNAGFVLVAGAPLIWTHRLAALAAAGEQLIAVDSGADHLARIGLRAAAVIGDLDSLSRQTRSWLGEETLIHRPDQDRTDLDKALQYVFDELGAAGVTVLAALGGRTDHEIGNLGLLARHAMGEGLVFEADDHRVLAVKGDTVLASREGETWSFWTYDPAVRVTIEGVRWPLNDTAISVGDRPSISNEAVADEIQVHAQGGSVVVMRQFARHEVVKG